MLRRRGSDVQLETGSWYRGGVHGGGTGHAVGQGGDGAAEVPLRIPSRSGTVAVKVIDYDRAREGVLRAALEQGAALVDSHTEVNFQGKRQGWMRFRGGEPAAAAAAPDPRCRQALCGEPQRGAHLKYEELERRVGRLREHQQRLAGVLQSPRRLRGSDILYLQERLFRAGIDEELLQRRLDLERAARISTLVVELFEPEPRRVMDLGNYYAGAARGPARHSTGSSPAASPPAPTWRRSRRSGRFCSRMSRCPLVIGSKVPG